MPFTVRVMNYVHIKKVDHFFRVRVSILTFGSNVPVVDGALNDSLHKSPFL